MVSWSPSSQISVRSSGTPMICASSAWWTRWRYSPWTGTNHCGSTTDMSVLISSCLAWPVACTSSRPECTTLAPRRTSPSITFVTLISLPGIGCELRITVSPAPISSQRFSRLAIRVRADIGSPWLPVEITQTEPSG